MWHGRWRSFGEQFGKFDAVFLPVNAPIVAGDPPSEVPAVMGPAQAVDAAILLRAERLVPIHCVVMVFCFKLRSFFQRTQNLFVTCVIGSHRSQSQHIAAQVSQKFTICDFVASTQSSVTKTGIACEQGCQYIEYRCASC